MNNDFLVMVIRICRNIFKSNDLVHWSLIGYALYSTSPGKPLKSISYFDWFNYKGISEALK